MFVPSAHAFLPIAVIGLLLCGVPVASAQTDWTELSPKSSPSGPTGQAMAYDSVRGRVVLFGGQTGAGPYYSIDQTWEWDGSDWHDMTLPTGNPRARIAAGFAYDAHRRRAVLFGGAHSTSLYGDTWEWGGKTWTRCSPKTSPPARHSHTMTYDAVRGRVVLFGGFRYNPRGPVGDTWEWDGVNWKDVTPASGNPPARYMHAMAYHRLQRRVVIFGGAGTSQALADMWAWDGRAWTNCAPRTSPSARYMPAMAYDSARNRLVLFGGCVSFTYPRPGGGCWNDTWEWDGVDWRQLSLTKRPHPEWSNTMVYDATHGGMLLYSPIKPPQEGETWRYAPVDLLSSSHTVSVAQGGNVGLTLDAGPVNAGKSYLVLGSFAGTGPGLKHGSIELHLNADFYFIHLLTNPNTLVLDSLGTLSSQARNTATIRVPARLPTALVGTRVHHAYIVYGTGIDYASSPVPLTFTP